MKYEKCRLYNVTRKRDLKTLLNYNVKNFNNYNVKYRPFIDKKNRKKRLIENPNDDIKLIQRKIKNYLCELDYQDNVFSGVPGKSYIDNALYHINSKYFLKIDMSKFFPNTHREMIYNFYKQKLKVNSDIAKILTDLSTVSLKKITTNEINDFITDMNIKSLNHLPTGSPISSIMSYLANIDMFEEIELLAKKNNCIISIYVDDITISSDIPIPKFLISQINSVVIRHCHIINMSKTKSYYTNDFKKITGCIISKNKKLVIPNKIKYKIAKKLKQEDYNEKELQSLLGLIFTAQIFDESKYKCIQKKIKDKLKSNDFISTN